MKVGLIASLQVYLLKRAQMLKNIYKNTYFAVFKIGVFKNFSIFTVKRLCWNLFFNKVAGIPEKWGLRT